MLFLEALSLARVPRLSLVVRKAFGLAFFSMGGSNMGSDLLVAWPGAEIGFMDPVVVPTCCTPIDWLGSTARLARTSCTGWPQNSVPTLIPARSQPR